MPESLERRAERRFALELPVQVREAGAEVSIMGMTKNLSEKGAFLVLFHEFQPRPEIDFIVEFPPELTLANPRSVRCKGITKRVEEDRLKGLGVAVRIDGYEFL